MSLWVNPFQELYVTETIAPRSFPKVFSTHLMTDALPLFQPGNVLLVGSQGTGKSMLLALLKPEIRIGYADVTTAGPFPVPHECSRFVGAGINISRSAVIDIGQRAIGKDPEREAAELPGYFADFINYWVALDILASIDVLARGADGRVAQELGLSVATRKLDGFAATLSRHPCWVGYLDGVRDYEGLKVRMQRRIAEHRDFFNYTGLARTKFPRKLAESRTSIGEPISQTAHALRAGDVVPEDVPFFIRIDQTEVLLHVGDPLPEHGLLLKYRQVINKLLGRRDPRVSYRIGTRPYAYRRKEDSQMYGTTSSIEALRDYRTVDLDKILRRPENTTTWRFPAFAEDVFKRRLIWAGYDVGGGKKRLVRTVFGRFRMRPEEKALMYAKRNPMSAVRVEPSWPSPVKRVLTKLLDTGEVLSAKLGEAWVRQQLDPERRGKPLLPSGDFLPWKTYRERWWRKERIALALLQIAARRGQRMVWAGEVDMRDLSGSCILGFISMCERVWRAWLRSLQAPELERQDSTPPRISSPAIQSEGIWEASAEWHSKIATDADGDRRMRFVDYIAGLFRKELRQDSKMSYPGHNGFSLAVTELERDTVVADFLRDAVGYGVLIERRHTPKSASQGERRKWYLNPILSPFYQLPAAHTKEPKYVTTREVRAWLRRARAIGPRRKG